MSFFPHREAAGIELYPPRAVEREMKVQDVILRAMSGQIKWVQAAFTQQS